MLVNFFRFATPLIHQNLLPLSSLNPKPHRTFRRLLSKPLAAAVQEDPGVGPVNEEVGSLSGSSLRGS